MTLNPAVKGISVPKKRIRRGQRPGVVLHLYSCFTYHTQRSLRGIAAGAVATTARRHRSIRGFHLEAEKDLL